MKSFSDVLEAKVATEDLPSIYCDMDEVLCNFMKGADHVGCCSIVQAYKADRWN